MRLSILVLLISLQFSCAQKIVQPMQDSLPYYEIPEYPSTYTATSVVARMIDGLGFRYYWATMGLRQEDLDFKPSPDARTSAETLDHIYGLVSIVLNSVMLKPTISPAPVEVLTFEEKRIKTLLMLKKTSDVLKSADPESLSEMKIIFQSADKTTEIPFWNQLNGPIADALWHVGQVVSMRRGSGNPFDSKVSVFSGKRRE